MDEDTHLGTGQYDPEKYWSTRADVSNGDIYQAVCAFGLSELENRAMEKVQLSLLSSVLRSVTLRGAGVMELGCGVGRIAGWFIRRGAVYTGTDISESMLKIASERIRGAKLYKLDSTELPFPSDSFDLVCSITVLHHNPYERQAELIKEMIRVAKPGGLILLMESVNPANDRVSFNMFPRKVGNWVSFIEKGDRARLVTIKVARWWLLRDMVFGIARGVRDMIRRPAPVAQAAQEKPAAGQLKKDRKARNRVNAVLVRIGMFIDPYIMALLPQKYALNAAMLFRKTGRQE